MKTIILLGTILLISLTSMATPGSPAFRIDAKMRAKLGQEIKKEDFRYLEQSYTNVGIKNATEFYNGVDAELLCQFSLHFYSKQDAVNGAPHAGIVYSSQGYEYRVNDARYFENGVVYTAWQQKHHAYNVEYPRSVIRIFDRTGKTTELAYQDGFNNKQTFCFGTK